MTDYISIKNWADDDKPREKLAHQGRTSLSNAELIAILLSNGTKNKSALDLAREILQLAAQTKLTDHQITLPQLAPGLYTVSLQTKKGSYHHWKILHVE